MALFEKMNAAIAKNDTDAYLALYDDEAVFVRHQSGTTMTKAEFAEMVRRLAASDDAEIGQRRCLYENGDILVVHSVNGYPDGTREAVLMACTLKDGKITRVETGATPLKK